MDSQNIYTAIDIGSSNVKVVIGEMRGTQLHVIGESNIRSEGLRKGIIVDIEKTLQSVKEAIVHAEKMTGYQVQEAVVSISAHQAEMQRVKGVVTVTGNEVTNDDLQRVMDSASSYKLPEGRERVNVVPIQFTVDDCEGITDPRGMIGVRLEVDALMITTSATLMHNILRCVERASIQIHEIYFQPLVVGHAALTKDEKQQGTACIDIGGSSTTVSYYEEGILQNAKVIPLGGDTITQDISIVLKTSTTQAEYIKKQYGHAYKNDASDQEFFEVPIEGTDTVEQYSQRYLSEIMGARLIEIIEFAIDALAQMGVRDLPGGVVLTGGCAMIEGIAPLTRQVMQTRVRIYTPQFISVREPGYAAAVGLIDYATQQDNFFKRAAVNTQQPLASAPVDTVENTYYETPADEEEPKEKGPGWGSKMKKMFNSIFE